MADTRELILRFTGDPRHLKQTLAQVRAELSQFSQGQVTTAQGVARQTQQSEQRRIADTVRAANQRLREEQRAAREVARITAETARQADRQERIREQAAKRLADAQIREAKRAARELERSLAAGRGGGGFSGGDITGSIASITSSLPIVGRLTSQFSGVTAGATAAGGAIGAVAGPIALVTAAAAAGIIVLVKLGTTFFDAAKEAAAFTGKFQDLSQQVGVSVETLSTLDIAASTTGGNIETVSASLAIFQKNLEEAHDPTSKEAKLLKELGVTSLDTEVALRQTIAGLFRLGEGSKQTEAVLQLFGRSGRFVNAILKESEGDLDKATKKFQEMGLVVSTKAAVAADRFNDSLEILDRQIASVTRTLVSDSIPVFIVFFEEISKGLTGNADSWQNWGRLIEAQVAGVIGTFKTLVQFVASRGTLDIESALNGNIEGILDAAERVRNKIGFEADLERIQRLSRGILAGRPGDRPDASKAASEAAARANKDIQLQQQALEESTRVNREALERERDLDIKSIEEWKEAAIDAQVARLADQQRILEQEKENARQFIKNREDLRLAIAEIDQKDEKAQNDFSLAVNKIRDEANKRRNEAFLNVNRQLLELSDSFREAEREKIKADLEDGIITLSGAKQRELALLTQAQVERLELIKLELNQQTTSAARKIELDIKKQQSEANYTKEFKRLTRERIDALVEEGAAQTPTPNEGRRIPENEFVPIDIGEPPRGLTLWEQAIESLQERLISFREFAQTALVGVFEGLAGAVGSAVEAWALYGESIGVAMKKSLAAVLARIAGESAAMAALHSIYALASLAFLDFRGAAQHALVALQFAALAAATGIGARAIAGNSFQQSGGGGGAGGGPRGGTSDRNRERDPIDLLRTQQRQEIHIFLHGEPGPGFDQQIIRTIVKDVRTNGPMRDTIINTAGG